jgi:hypothetical protein
MQQRDRRPPVSNLPKEKNTMELKGIRPAHDPGIEEVVDDIIDIEEYAKRGERPPLSKGYRIRVNGEPFVVHDPTPTGRAILTLAGLLPPKDYTLRVKLAGQKPQKVDLDEKVDLRKPGVEKFKALPRDQTEG